ncbi:uncharacterized protein ACNLHF_011304 [Anomaloglossus baeobatrachus]|uniref:uncharacterized protein LOC142290211 n=1 Tax=Anomaloglossus baeobatrachus TaxID=238106 RepID=UPI003F4FA3F7
MSSLNMDLERDFAKWEKEIIGVKTKKYQRDASDYSSGYVYRWRHNRPPKKRGTRSRSGSFSSISSTEDAQPMGNKANKFLERFQLPVRMENSGGRGPNQKRKLTPPQSLDKKSKNDLQVINLSNISLSKDQVEVLKLGLSFSPDSNFDSFTVIKDLHLFSRKLVLHKLHSRSNTDPQQFSPRELEAIATLEELEEESMGTLTGSTRCA